MKSQILSQRGRLGVKGKILAAFLVISIIALFITGVFTFVTFQEMRIFAEEQSAALGSQVKQNISVALEQSAEESLLTIASDRAEISDRYFDQVQAEIQIIRINIREIMANPAKYPQYLTYSTKDSPVNPKSATLFFVASGAGTVYPNIESSALSSADPLLISLVNSDPRITAAYIGTSSGMFRVAPWEPYIHPNYDPRVRGWYQNAITSKNLTWSAPYVDEAGHGLMVTCSAPVESAGQNGTWVIGADLTLETINQQIIKTRIGERGYSMLIDNAGNVIARPGLTSGDTTWDESFKTENLLQSNNSDLRNVASAMVAGKTGIERVRFSDGERYIAYAPVKKMNWSIGVVVPVDEITSPAATTGDTITATAQKSGVYFIERIDALKTVLLLTLFFIMVALGVLSFWFSQLITRPLEQLRKGSEAIGKGNLDYQVDIRSGDEFELLAQSFNGMAADLKTKVIELEQELEERRKAQKALIKSEEKYRTILENIQDVFYRSDQDGTLVMASPSWASMLGYDSLDECLGYSIAEKFYMDPDQRKEFVDAVARNGSVSDFEVVLKKKDGLPLNVSTNSHLIYDESGAVGGVEGIFRDITERKRAEENLLRKNEELNAAYEQLTATEEEVRYNYDELHKIQQALTQARKKLNLLNSITFQDIQNALFSLEGYLELQKELPMDEKAGVYLKREREVAEKISNTLAFAKNYQDMGIKPPLWQNINQVFLLAISHLDLSKIVRKDNLDNLELYADPLLETVFFNLAENLMRHGKTATEISLHYRETTDSLTVFIEDNGAGIPDADKKKIFERGYGARRGMGLFLVQEILGITNISIKETGTYGKGARFEITVPKGAYRFRTE